MAQYGKGVVNRITAIFDKRTSNNQQTPQTKKRKLEIGNEGKPTSSIPANPPVFKFDFVNCLAEFSNVQNEHTAELFTKHAEQTQERTKVLLCSLNMLRNSSISLKGLLGSLQNKLKPSFENLLKPPSAS